MHNLLINAIKFTEQGEIHLRLTAVHVGTVCTLCIEVEDTGPGLTPEQCQRLFQRFEQAEGAQTSNRYGGSGLGLAICRELTGLMHGSIAVNSRPGQGACFRVELPVVVSRTRARSAPTYEAGMLSKRILLVENDKTEAQRMTEFLRVQGAARPRCTNATGDAGV